MAIKRKKTAFEIRPAVCAAGDNYIICVPSDGDMLMSIFVGGEEFTNDNCGVKVSSCYVHKFSVPAEKLNRAKLYTVCYERIVRKAYFSDKEAPVKKDFLFYPVENKEDINIYHLSDVHGKMASAVNTGGFFNDNLDILILNGDISSSSQTAKETLAPLDLAYEITKGERTCIITRGNHDLRGVFAEKIHEFYPLDNGNFYYVSKVGRVLFIVLDCGEDKNDDHPEYAGTIAFHKYRQRETDFIKKLAADIENGDVSGYERIVVVSHIPFCHRNYDPGKEYNEFDIENGTYGEWINILNEQIKPSFGIFGHVHSVCVCRGEGEYNQRKLDCPIILGGKPLTNDVIGCALTLGADRAQIFFTNSSKKILDTNTIEL